MVQNLPGSSVVASVVGVWSNTWVARWREERAYAVHSADMKTRHKHALTGAVAWVTSNYPTKCASSVEDLQSSKKSNME